MDEQNQVEEHDLPLLSTFYCFIAAYASLHKFFLPIALKFTNLKGTDYAAVQPTLILPLALALLITRKPRNLPGISALSGAAVLFAVYEVYLTSRGVYLGWIAFSRLLSSIPLAIVSVIFLSKSIYHRFHSYAWLGVAVFACFIFGNEWKRAPGETPTPEVTKIEEGSRMLPKSENAACGAQALLLTGSEALPSKSLKIEACGLSPSFLQLAEPTLSIENMTDKPVNLHLLISDGEKNVTGWNMLVRAHETAQSRRIELKEATVGLLYSDTEPQVGIVAILPRSANSHWAMTRKPITVKRLP